MRVFLVSLLFVSSVCASAQRLSFQIIGGQDSDADYSYVVPWHYTSHSWSNGPLSANCSSLDLVARRPVQIATARPAAQQRLPVRFPRLSVVPKRWRQQKRAAKA
jgi:hypothetical protein